MLRGINLTNGYLQINFNKEKGIVEIKIFNNEDNLVFTGSTTGYDFTKALISDKAPIEGTISFDDSISGLNDAINTCHYITDSLNTLKDIYNSGDCNSCSNRGCSYRPDYGELVRYNCPFYKK